jgi:hypothetical protein
VVFGWRVRASLIALVKSDLAEDWAGVPHGEYCRCIDGHIKWMRSHGVPVRAVAPILVDEYTAWCEERGEEPEDARAAYAADRFRRGGRDSVAARSQRAVLVRLATQVQEVLRSGGRCTTPARNARRTRNENDRAAPPDRVPPRLQ